MVLIQQLLRTDKAQRHDQSPTKVDNTILLQDQKLPQYFIANPLFPCLSPLKTFWHAYAKQRGEHYRL